MQFTQETKQMTKQEPETMGDGSNFPPVSYGEVGAAFVFSK